MWKRHGHVVFRVSQSHAFHTSIPHFTFRIPQFHILPGPMWDWSTVSTCKQLVYLQLIYFKQLVDLYIYPLPRSPGGLREGIKGLVGNRERGGVHSTLTRPLFRVRTSDLSHCYQQVLILTAAVGLGIQYVIILIIKNTVAWLGWATYSPFRQSLITVSSADSTCPNRTNLWMSITQQWPIACGGW